jgi:hypothetical protein
VELSALIRVLIGGKTKLKTQTGKPRPVGRAGRTAAHPRGWRADLRSWAVTLAIFLFVVTSVGQGYVIPTGSMENTLLIGDHLVVDKLGYPGPTTC